MYIKPNIVLQGISYIFFMVSSHHILFYVWSIILCNIGKVLYKELYDGIRGDMEVMSYLSYLIQ